MLLGTGVSLLSPLNFYHPFILYGKESQSALVPRLQVIMQEGSLGHGISVGRQPNEENFLSLLKLFISIIYSSTVVNCCTVGFISIHRQEFLEVVKIVSCKVTHPPPNQRHHRRPFELPHRSLH